MNTPIPALTGLRAAVLEDEFFIGIFLSEALESFGCEVLAHVMTVAKARAFLEREHPDFMLLDVNLGKETSFPIADMLEQRGIPFLFVTGYGAESMRGRYADHPRVLKPVDDAELIEALVKLVDGKTPGSK
jgi:CheY-like chemotaxis protein